MFSQTILRSLFFSFLIALLSACGGSGGGSDDSDANTNSNNPTTPTGGLPEGPLPVVFMADNGSFRGVYSALDDGSTPVRLDTGLELMPNLPLPRDFRVSPNREWVAILSADVSGATARLWIASMDGTILNEIATIFGNMEDYSWSPTGDALVFVADQDIIGVHEVYLAMADGSSVNKINNPVTAFDNRDFESPLWSPDGRYVMFEVHSFASSETEGIDVHDRNNPSPAATGITSGITGPFELIHNIQWSPDSSQVAFIYDSPTTSTFELWTSLVDGSGSTQINPLPSGGGTGVSMYDWSPDSSQIAYVSRQRNTQNPEVYVAGSDGSSPTIQHTPFSDSSARGARDVKWSPDGSYLAYTSSHMVGPSSFQLYVVTNRTDNRDAAVLATNFGGTISQWEWMPDSSSIVYRGTSFSVLSRIYKKDALELHSPTSVPAPEDNLGAFAIADGDITDFELSPDGENIAFLQTRTFVNTEQLYANSTAGGMAASLHLPFSNASPKNIDVYQWSPAGDRVIHGITTLNGSGMIQGTNVFATDPDGSNLRLLNNSGVGLVSLVGGLVRASY